MFSKDSFKNAVLSAKNKIEAEVSDLSNKAAELASSSTDAVMNFDYEGAQNSIKDKALIVGENISNAATSSVEAIKNFDIEGVKNHALVKFEQLSGDISDFKDKSIDAITKFDFDEAKESASQFSLRSVTKLNQYFRTTFELDKTTFEMVDEIRNRLPTPASSMDEIYEQCRNEAIRRAIAAFMLGNIIDDRSQAKYDKLSDSYDTYRTTQRDTFGNYPAPEELANSRDENILLNDYNPDGKLLHQEGKASVDHVTSRKEIFSSLLLKAGLTNEELGQVVNHPANLKLMVQNLNSQKSDMDMYEWLAKFSRPHPDDPTKLIVTIRSSSKEFIVDKKAVDDMYKESKDHIRNAKIQAAKEIGATVVLTGATMAAQQVVGLIVVETIDVFMDELKRVKLVSSDGLIEELKNSQNRLTQNLNERFEQRQIWSRAKSLGIEAGVAGALSVIPQILISLVLKMPAFAYAIIRESTLSVVRAVRVLSSNDEDKFATLQVILFGAASAVAGIYVQRVISQAIVAVPLLNRFNSQVSGILTGVLVTAIPLAAIYTFEQNKSKLTLKRKPDF